MSFQQNRNIIIPSQELFQMFERSALYIFLRRPPGVRGSWPNINTNSVCLLYLFFYLNKSFSTIQKVTVAAFTQQISPRRRKTLWLHLTQHVLYVWSEFLCLGLWYTPNQFIYFVIQEIMQSLPKWVN